MRKILIVLVSAVVFLSLSVTAFAAAAQPNLKALLGDKTVTLKGVFSFVEYDDAANAEVTLKVSSLVKEKNSKIKRAFNGKEALLYVAKGTPTVCTEDTGPIDFFMFGYKDKFEMSVKMNADGKLQVQKIRSLTYHCNPASNVIPKVGPERDNGESVYHGTISGVDMQKKTFNLDMGGDLVYHVNASKISKVTVQHSPKTAYFTMLEKLATIKDGDNGYVKGYFNNQTFVITPKRIRIAN